MKWPSLVAKNVKICVNEEKKIGHGFGQAKFDVVRLVLGSSQFSLLPQLPQK